MNEQKKGFFSSILIGSAAAFGFMIIGIAVFAAVVKICCLNASVIKAVNQFIKVIAIFFGCMIAVKNSVGYIKGALVGIIAIFFIYLLFAFFGGFNGHGLLLDLLFSAIIGSISGIVSVNIKNR